jgi:hypothetical protein
MSLEVFLSTLVYSLSQIDEITDCLLDAMTAFNDGSSTGPGDRTGDYNARVQAVRRSNSADPVGILRLEGRITRCQNAACSTEQQIVPPKDLGVTTPIGVAFAMRLIWDAPNNQFLAGANANANVALKYTANDALPAIQRSAGIEIRNSTATCVAGATEADLDVVVDRQPGGELDGPYGELRSTEVVRGVQLVVRCGVLPVLGVLVRRDGDVGVAGQAHQHRVRIRQRTAFVQQRMREQFFDNLTRTARTAGFDKRK